MADNHTPPLFSSHGDFSKVIQSPKMVLFCKIRDYKSNMYSGFINSGTLNFCVQIWPPENNRLPLQKQISIHR
nr:MAG TPA: hypothetical protein [Caudoviricetes sp.]